MLLYLQSPLKLALQVVWKVQVCITKRNGTSHIAFVQLSFEILSGTVDTLSTVLLHAILGYLCCKMILCKDQIVDNSWMILCMGVGRHLILMYFIGKQYVVEKGFSLIDDGKLGYIISYAQGLPCHGW